MIFPCVKCKIHNYKYTQIRKYKVLKRPYMCYIFEKHGIQRYQIWHSLISYVKYINTWIHKYATTQIQSAQKIQYVLYFWKAQDSWILNITFPCIKCEIHKYTNTQIKSALKTQHMLYFWKSLDSRISNMTFQCIKFKIQKHKNMHIIISSYRSI